MLAVFSEAVASHVSCLPGGFEFEDVCAGRTVVLRPACMLEVASSMGFLFPKALASCSTWDPAIYDRARVAFRGQMVISMLS